MPRNGSGSYSLPESPFVSNTTISSTAMNSDLSDIGSALTASVARDGQSAMSAVLPLANAGFTYSIDTNTGMYRSAADTQRIKAGGTDIVEISTSGITQLAGIGMIPAGLGPLPWCGTTAPSLWLFCYGQSLSRTTYAALYAAIGTTFGSVDGSSFSLPDMRGRSIFGRDDMGGTAAGRLSTAVGSIDGLTVGAVGGFSTHTNQSNETSVHTHTGGAGTGPFSVQAGATPAVPAGANTGGVVENSGVPVAWSIMNPAIVLNYIICAGV